MNILLSKIILLTFTINLVFVGIDAGKKPRIYYGENADIKDYPYMAIVGSKIHTDNSSRCGGTIIHRKFVVTAARCISKCTCIEEAANRKKIVKCVRYSCKLVEPGTIWVRAGSTFGHQRAIQNDEASKLIYHPLYDGKHRFDVGLIKLKNAIDIPYTKALPLKLPRPRDVINSTATAFTLGWGLTDKPTNNVLQKANLEILSNDQCEWHMNLTESPLEDSHVCAGDSGGICFGDAGAPLIYDNKLHGIATFPISVDCESEMPSLFLRLPLVLDWLAYALIYL
ncbi:serine protease 28-like [Chrysoperla carnea]|uniref:serine protease 28-like n=1 Tax=Chrysoperla carnea TaxID=189513 RepID=UPI001D060F6D|nr:serine protease 28-like [Chrysoperla carnea]